MMWGRGLQAAQLGGVKSSRLYVLHSKEQQQQTMLHCDPWLCNTNITIQNSWAIQTMYISQQMTMVTEKISKDINNTKIIIQISPMEVKHGI